MSHERVAVDGEKPAEIDGQDDAIEIEGRLLAPKASVQIGADGGVSGVAR